MLGRFWLVHAAFVALACMVRQNPSMAACMREQSKMVNAGHSSRLIFHTFSNTGELSEGKPILTGFHLSRDIILGCGLL